MGGAPGAAEGGGGGAVEPVAATTVPPAEFVALGVTLSSFGGGLTGGPNDIAAATG